MKAPTSVFQLARMRHVDLLALWHRLNQEATSAEGVRMAALSKDQLATILAAT